MRKLYGMLCLILILSAYLPAQDKNVIMDEWFIVNTNNWPINNDNKLKTQLGSGSYTIESFEENGSYIVKETGLDYSNDFSIAADIQFAEGDANAGYGILFGFKNWDNYYEFLISESGYYQIIHADQGIRTTTGWIRSYYVHNSGLPNKLKIVKVNDWMGFYLNNIFVDITISRTEPFFVKMLKADNFAGSRIGFVTTSKMKINSTRLEIKVLGLDETSEMTDVLGTVLADEKPVTLLSDDFSSNVNNWDLMNNDTSCVEAIKDGVFSFDKRDNLGRAAIKSVFLSTSGNYDIQCRTRRIGGADSSMYGLTWGLKDWNNQQQFGIDAKGNCKYAYNVYGTWNSITAQYKPMEENLLKISRVKDSLYFYVNGQMVIKAPNLSPAGFDAGLLVFDRQKVLFDDLKITQVKTYPEEFNALTLGEETMQTNEGAFSDLSPTESLEKDWKPGMIEYNHKTDDGSSVWKEYSLKPLDNFSISEKIKWIDGDSTSGYGILWGHRNWDNYNEFIITKNGYFRCVTVHNKTVISTGWKRSLPFVKGDDNTLEVIRRGSFAEFYINGQLAALMPFYELYGYFTGIIIYGKQTVGLENLTVKSIPVNKPELEPGHLIFKDDYETAENRPNPDISKEQTFRVEYGRLFLTAQFPELSDDAEENGEESEYPNNRTFCYSYADVLPLQLSNGATASAFSVETTVDLTRSSRNWGAGIRVGNIDFLVDSKGNYSIGGENPKPIKDDNKPSAWTYKLRVQCNVTGWMEFYINGKYAASIKKYPENRSAGPVISAFNKPSDAWFDDFKIRSYDNENL